jgi:hypothetical protein
LSETVFPKTNMPALAIESVGLSDLRDRITELRNEIATATLALRAAKEQHQAEELAYFVRRKSLLTRQLIETQSELLAVFRAESLSLENPT